MPKFDAQSAECLVFTFKEGLLSPIAHDLKIRVRSFEIEIDDGASPEIRARFDASSLCVVCAMKDGAEDLGGLTSNDLAKIDDETHKVVLKAKKYPAVTFRSRTIEAEGQGFRVDGDLTLVGKTGRIRFAVRPNGTSWRAEVDLHQPDFGIKPYKALLGTLKIKPTLRVHVSIPRDQINIP